MDEIRYIPIGVIHSPFAEPKGVPIQAVAARGVRGRIDLDPGFADALSDLDGFSHAILLYHFHRAGPARLKVRPFLDTVERGVFSTRAPSRPNPIGLSIVKILSIDGPSVEIEDVDIVDGTPLLDIKPYVPAFDVRPDAHTGWIAERLDALPVAADDGRFLS